MQTAEVGQINYVLFLSSVNAKRLLHLPNKTSLKLGTPLQETKKSLQEFELV